MEENSTVASPMGISPGRSHAVPGEIPLSFSSFPYHQSVPCFILKNYPETSLNEWNSWNWQIKNSIDSADRLKEIFGEAYENVISSLPENHLPFRITPYFASLLSRLSSDHPLFRTMVPAKEELITGIGEMDDPLGEKNVTPVPHIVHRYPDRVLFTVTGFCAAYCRYCTRSHMVSQQNKFHVCFNQELGQSH